LILSDAFDSSSLRHECVQDLVGIISLGLFRRSTYSLLSTNSQRLG